MNDSAVAAIKYALEKCDDDSDSMMFLRYWNEGEFEVLRRNWPDIPDEVFIDADPLFKSPAHIEDGEEVKVVAWQHRVIAGQKMGCSGWNPGKGEEFERSYTVERRPLMTVAQHQRIVAALSAPPAAGVPERWKLVPVEPSLEMWAAFRNTDHGNIWFHQAYRAMLATAPTPPASEQQRAVVLPAWAEIDEEASELAKKGDHGWNAYKAELLRLNPHLAKGEGV